MKHFSYASLDSTSTEAFRLLKKGIQAPFAVSAKIQTAGRGQRSRVWESESGNFFLSIVCSIPRENVRFLPLQTACILAQFLEKKLTVRPMIKWPNDLLIDKKKCAGILCESFWQEHVSHTQVVIGIGINVDHAPKVSEYETTCLKEWFSTYQSAETLIEEFLEFWSTHSFSDTNILNDYEKYHIPKKSLWKDTETNILFTNEGFTSEGHLILRNVETGEMQELVSAQHSLRWQS